MMKLRCKILDGDWFLEQLTGLTVVVTKISRHPNASGSGFGCTVVLDEEPTNEDQKHLDVHRGDVIHIVESDHLEPLDTSMVPETHNKSLLLKQVWVFTEARNDAWYRCPPRDLAAYKEYFGEDWKDERVFEVGRRLDLA